MKIITVTCDKCGKPQESTDAFYCVSRPAPVAFNRFPIDNHFCSKACLGRFFFDAVVLDKEFVEPPGSIVPASVVLTSSEGVP